MPNYVPGDRVRYDDDPGEVLECRDAAERPGSFDYRVWWDNGHISWVWESDLAHEEQSWL